MEAQPMEEPPKRSNRTLIIVVVVLLTLCCCCTLAIAGYYGWQTYQTAQKSLDDFVPAPPEFDQPESNQPDYVAPEEPTLPDFDAPDLGREHLHREGWQMMYYAMIPGSSSTFRQ